MTLRQKLGALGEAKAAELLRSTGYRIVAQNHRCRRGEVDLIAERGDLLVFVEVRTRATSAFGGPEETVDARKQQRVVTAALDYLAHRRGPRRGIRFDVVAVIDGPRGATLQHFENAFDARHF
ncbi:MAG: YraN family protein [Myxococcales bacterium]|nr:YraN family protein [Myxococcales bacterium]